MKVLTVCISCSAKKTSNLLLVGINRERSYRSVFLVSGRASIVKLVDFQIVRESKNNKVFESILADGSLQLVLEITMGTLFHTY